MTPSEHVGQRVRMYREQKGLTLTRFASLLHKSPSTVSKYESGAIVIDVNVLVEMSEVLEVTVGQLLDYQGSQPAKERKLITGSFFQRADLFYLYSCIYGKTPQISAMELIRKEKRSDVGRCILYYDIEDYYHHTKSNFLYTGRFRCFDNGAVFHLENPYNPSDIAMVYAKSPFTSDGTAPGIFTFLPTRYRNPGSTKILFSTSELPCDEHLVGSLSVGGKNVVTTLRKNNLFLVE